MKKIHTLPFLAMLFLPFCGSKKADHYPAHISRAEISLSVELDVLMLACERRLSALEAQHTPEAAKVPQAQNLSRVSASEPVHE